MSNFYQKLCDAISAASVREQEPMSAHTTFRAGGPARYFVIPEGEKELAAVLAACREAEKAYYILGNGSNLLVSDAGYPGVMILLGSQFTEVVCPEGEPGVYELGAGVLLSRAAREAQKDGMTGFEFAAGIPGTVGGAAVMNAGAYGVSVADAVTAVLAWDLWRGKTVSLPFDACAFGYRTSLFQGGRYVILSVSLRLTPSREDMIRATMHSLTVRRATSQPLDLPSAGSAFRRPVGAFAAKLIEEAGLRGYSIGGARGSDKHWGFLVNTGNATARDVRQLITLIQDRVHRQSGIYLIPEIVME